MKLLIKSSKIKQVSEQMQDLFDKPGLEQEAKSIGFVKRERKLGGSSFVQLCIHGVSKDGMVTSLTELCAVALGLNVELCPQSLNERFNDAGVLLMQKIFEHVMDRNLGDGQKLAVLKFFNGVYLQDATIYQLPDRLKELFKGSGGGASQAAIKIDCLTDIQAGKWYLHFKDGASSDGAAHLLSVPQKSLWLRDLGYFKLNDFQTIAEHGAFFVSRLRTDVKLQQANNGQAIDLLKWAKSMKEGQTKDIQVFVGSTHKGPFRLVLQKVPKEIATAKRDKLRTDKQNKRKGLTKRRLALCDLNMYLTNLEQPQWNPQMVTQLYRIRWQVEILFKAWKSILKIGRNNPMKPQRFLCLMYAQMAWALLNAKIFQFYKVAFWNDAQIEISELKAFKIMRQISHKLLNALPKNNRKLYLDFLQLLCQALEKLGVKKPRKTNKNEIFYMC